jgi:chemotaxis protein MotB
LQQDIQRYFKGTELSGQVTVIAKDSQITLRLIASVIFEPGSDRLKPEAETVLSGAAEIINRHAPAVKSIRTEGHTDSVNPPEGDIESKWELAARRAAKVLQHVLARAALDPVSAYTVGYGSARPVASDETVEGQEQNNRVDVVVTGGAAASS